MVIANVAIAEMMHAIPGWVTAHVWQKTGTSCAMAACTAAGSDMKEGKNVTGLESNPAAASPNSWSSSAAKITASIETHMTRAESATELVTFTVARPFIKIDGATGDVIWRIREC